MLDSLRETGKEPKKPGPTAINRKQDKESELLSAGESPGDSPEAAAACSLACWLAWPRYGFRAESLPPAESPNIPGLPLEH